MTGAMMVDLRQLTLLAEGAQARVYHYGDDRVLRIMRSAGDEAMLKNEIAVIGALRQAGVLVPEVYGYMEVDGYPSVVVEKIKGTSLMEYISRHIFRIRRIGRVLGELHLRLAQAASDVPLLQGRDRARYIVGRSDWLDQDLKDFILSLIDSFVEGRHLCHGNFHPGNILRWADKNYIIDWVGVYRGDILSDAANTYLLLTTIPRPPGVGPMLYSSMRLMGPLLSCGYMSAIRNWHSFDRGVFSQLLVVKAAEQAVHGMPGEEERLVKFIRTCHALHQKGVPPERWYKKL